MQPIHVERAGALSSNECDRAIELATAAGLEAATVWSGAGDVVDESARRASRAYLPRTGEAGWLYDRLDELFAAAALDLGVTVEPLREDVQIVRYDAGGHFQSWHSDAGTDRQGGRVLSVSVELSEVAEYTGGVLEVVPATVGRPRTLPRGGATVFLSRALHRVTPVTVGTRWSLVAWTGGAPAG